MGSSVSSTGPALAERFGCLPLLESVFAAATLAAAPAALVEAARVPVRDLDLDVLGLPGFRFGVAFFKMGLGVLSLSFRTSSATASCSV